MYKTDAHLFKLEIQKQKKIKTKWVLTRAGDTSYTKKANLTEDIQRTAYELELMLKMVF